MCCVSLLFLKKFLCILFSWIKVYWYRHLNHSCLYYNHKLDRINDPLFSIVIVLLCDVCPSVSPVDLWSQWRHIYSSWSQAHDLWPVQHSNSKWDIKVPQDWFKSIWICQLSNHSHSTLIFLLFLLFKCVVWVCCSWIISCVFWFHG